jgi:hypothetical protein
MSDSDANADDEFIESLKRNIEQTRLPPELKAQLLAEEPPLVEQERIYREMMEKGGLSFEQFFGALMAEFGETL